MAPLSRQTTPRLIDVDHGDIERWQQTTQEPSQADRYAKQQEGRRDSVVEVGAVADRGPPSPNSSVNLPYRFKAATGTSELSINASKTPPAQLTCRMIEPSPSPYVQSTEHEQVLPASNQYNDTDSVLTDYAEFKTQHIFRNDDEVLSLPDYDNASGESSPDGSPIMPLRLTRLYEAATGPSRTPSPTHGVALRSTDVGSVFWKFSVSGWLGGEGADATEASLDDVDDDSDRTEKDNSHICPSSTEAHRTPSMGSRLDFELQRSDRNMRYNALQAESAGHVAEDSERPESSTWTFCLNQTVQEIELPLSDPVHTFATRSARIAQQKSGHGKENSVDAGSLTSGGSTRQMLESAVRDTNYAEAMLMDGSEDHNSHHHPAYANAPDAVQTSSPVRLTEWERQALQTAIPSQAYDTNRPFLRNDRSPKRITQAELILPATLSSSPMGGITSGGFSPTASIREVSSNRFAALDDDNMPSSPPEPLARYESHGRAPGGFKLASQAVRHEYGLPAKPSDFLVGMNSPNSGYEADSSASAESPETSPLGREQVGGRARYRNLPSAARGE
ncbi:hypothetical protein B0A55_07105 [Friedmanniomyces simplex]|uniref:Uncharacterized protein n=1 Tax=Friedmanniomyces simplex TaxID=329884 RepID=A0A4U0XD82_9PEZI|nr:hypothetical protein B0A55_07105 [Friedmanniomyces simplex]